LARKPNKKTISHWLLAISSQ